jgi:hypothetical protein
MCRACSNRLKKYRRWKFDIPKACTELQVRQLLPPGAEDLMYRYADIPNRKTMAVSYWVGQWGKDGNGYFCSSRCGFDWAVRTCAVDQIYQERKKR